MLIRLSEAVLPTTVGVVDAFSSMTAGWYMPRYDAAWYTGSSFLGSHYKIFRDGSVVRTCVAAARSYGYDADLDRVMSFTISAAPLSHDPIGMKHDPGQPAALTYTGLILAGHALPFVWHGYYYTIFSTTVTKRNLATGAAVTTYTLTGVLPFPGGARLDITPDGVLVAWVDNGTTTTVRFFDLTTSTNLYESVIDRAVSVFVDRVHKNIWAINFNTLKTQVYSFDVAPYIFSPFTMGANKSRYRQDTLSGTLLGSHGEPVRFWPVGWRLTQPIVGGGFLGDVEVGAGPLGSGGSGGPSAEGHLEHSYTETDAAGVTENLYCGPGSVDYVG